MRWPMINLSNFCYMPLGHRTALTDLGLNLGRFWIKTYLWVLADFRAHIRSGSLVKFVFLPVLTQWWIQSCHMPVIYYDCTIQRPFVWHKDLHDIWFCFVAKSNLWLILWGGSSTWTFTLTITEIRLCFQPPYCLLKRRGKHYKSLE